MTLILALTASDGIVLASDGDAPPGLKSSGASLGINLLFSILELKGGIRNDS